MKPKPIKGILVRAMYDNYVVLTDERMIRAGRDGSNWHWNHRTEYVSKAFVRRVLESKGFFFKARLAPSTCIDRYECFVFHKMGFVTTLFIGCFMFRGKALATVKRWAGYRD